MARDPFDVVRRFDELPDDALVADKPTSILLNISDRLLRRNPPIPKVRIGPRTGGYRAGDIRAFVRGKFSVATS